MPGRETWRKFQGQSGQTGKQNGEICRILPENQRSRVRLPLFPDLFADTTPSKSNMQKEP
eukprot:1159271-Pelagomonas_calceolata.AAC.3